MSQSEVWNCGAWSYQLIWKCNSLGHFGDLQRHFPFRSFPIMGLLGLTQCFKSIYRGIPCLWKTSIARAQAGAYLQPLRAAISLYLVCWVLVGERGSQMDFIPVALLQQAANSEVQLPLSWLPLLPVINCAFYVHFLQVTQTFQVCLFSTSWAQRSSLAFS